MYRSIGLASTLAAALSLLVCGCTDGLQSFEKVYDPCAPLVLFPSGEVSTAQWQSVEDGVAMWRDVAAVGVSTEDTADARRLPIEMVDTALYMGAFDDTQGLIRLARGVEDRHARAVVLAHELGHAFNLFHVAPKERVSVMNKGNREVAPTSGDAEALAEKWGPCVLR